MDLQNLFEMQAVLDADIIKRHPVQLSEDRLSKKILALLVELGECANEWRGFKFWSNDQRPRTEIFVECKACQGTGDANYEMIQEDAEGIGQHEYIECVDCEGRSSVGPKNPLLEEYVDCLHFILSIGNEMKFEANQSIKLINTHKNWILESRDVKNTSVTEQFIIVFNNIHEFEQMKGLEEFYYMISEFFILGAKLGLTDEQVEQAYYDKNKINFERQANNY